MSSFGEATGGQRAGRVAALVALGLWLAASAAVVLLLTVMGFASCSTEACSDRATLAFLLTPGIHVVALAVGAWLALRRSTGGRRTLGLAALAVAAPVLSLGAAILLAAGST